MTLSNFALTMPQSWSIFELFFFQQRDELKT